MLNTVLRNTERLKRLVDDLLFLARLESSGLKLELRQVDVAQIVRQAADQAMPTARLKHVELQVAIDQLPPAHCDPTRLAQLIDNLVANAIKFTPAGGRVTLSGHQETDAIAVTDTGIGIPDDEIALIFTRFYRASTATHNAIPGTGLGLAISQAIAQAHNTRIEVNSRPGEETTFSFLLPTTQPRQLDSFNHQHAQVTF